MEYLVEFLSTGLFIAALLGTLGLGIFFLVSKSIKTSVYRKSKLYPLANYMGAFAIVASSFLTIYELGIFSTSKKTTPVHTEEKPKKVISIPIYDDENVEFWNFEDVYGQDDNGKLAKFRIAVITENDKWEYASYTNTERGMLSTLLPRYLRRLVVFDHAIGFVGVGVASEEGNRVDEINRADRRADEIITTLRPEIGNRSLYKLNLGQYKVLTGLAPNHTAWQRRVVVVAILSLESGMQFPDVKIALRRALTTSRGFSFNNTDYSNFDLAQFQ